MTIITRDPAATLELCYVWQKLQPANLEAVKPSDYVPSRGAMWRIKRGDKGRVILDIPPQRHDVKETKRGRAGTASRIATGAMIGHILHAAENQSKPKAHMLRFLFDPECPVEIRGAMSVWARERMVMLLTARETGKRKRVAETDIADALLLQFSELIRCGKERYTETQLAQYAGFADMPSANWERDWRSLSTSLMLQMQDFAVVAMRPVVDRIRDIFEDPRNDRHIPMHPFERPPEEAPNTEHYRAPNHGKTLSLKKVLAI